MNFMKFSINPLSSLMTKFLVLSLIIYFVNFNTLLGQVHYKDDGKPWSTRTKTGPDAEVPGWYYNLGITGIRVQLDPVNLKALQVKYVFAKSPASKKVYVNDLIVGVNGKNFQKDHLNGYGMDKFGAQGPIEEFAHVLEKAQTFQGRGYLTLNILRKNKPMQVRLKVSTKYGAYADSYPVNCQKSKKITKELLDYIIKNQFPNGGFGHPVDDLWCPLALMASGDRKSMQAVKKNVYLQARSVENYKNRNEGLINWHYVTAGIVLSEYYLKTRDRKILPAIQLTYDFLYKSQYTDYSQVSKRDPLGNPNRKNPTKEQAKGGWGHNPGYQGYGPIAMITGKGALALTLMSRCGIEVDQDRLKMAFDFLHRGTGNNGYTWYADKHSAHNKYADMGRTGVSAIAHSLASDSSNEYKKHALLQSKLIGDFPLSFPDTHASPLMGMGYTALGAALDKNNFQRLMKANRYWFTLSQCYDKTFYYQPNRDSNGYGADSRLLASAVVALTFQIPKQSLYITGKR